MSTGIINGNVFGHYVIGPVAITPAAVAANSAVEQSISLDVSAKVGSNDVICAMVPPSEVAGVSITYARVTALNTLAVKFVNTTAGSLTPPAGIWKLAIMRPEGGRFPVGTSE